MENNQYTSSETSESQLVDFVFKENTTIRTIPSTRILIAVGCLTKTYTTQIFENQNLNPTSSKRYFGLAIELNTTMDHVKMCETIARQLDTWEAFAALPEQVRQDVIGRLYTSTREIVNCTHTTYANCKIELRVDHTIRYVNSDVIMQQSFEESVHKMVPASDSSIKALKRIILVDGSCAENCSVCLEDFQDGCQVLCLPCSHEFHPDCITKWLNTSHYCPNCRYEMPAEK